MPIINTKLNLFSYISNKVETKKDVESELRKRVRYLYRDGRRECSLLAIKLNECSDEEPCCSAACPKCFRDKRIKFIAEKVSLIKFRYNWRIITLIFYSDMFIDEQLMDFDINKLKDRLRKKLRRIGYKGVVVGFFDLDYHSELDRWIPHFHLLANIDIDGIKALRIYMSRNEKITCRGGVVNRPILIQRLKNRFKQISYLHKFYWSRVEYYIDNKGKRRTKKYRLRDKQHCLSLMKLDQLGFKGLEFIYGTGRHSNL